MYVIGIAVCSRSSHARAPPDLDAADDGVTIPFDQSPFWDPTAAPSDPAFEFNQQLGA